MSKKEIKINDFELFIDVMKTAAKVVDAAKITISSDGMSIYGARGTIARCELESNAISSDEEFTIALKDLSIFNKFLTAVRDAHDDANEVVISSKFYFEQPFLKFESKKLKTKFSVVNEQLIAQWVSKKVETKMTSVFDFTTSTDLIKKLNGNMFMFSDSKAVRLYIETKDDMENNVAYATIGNKNVENSNQIIMKCGVVTFGKIPENRNIIVDFERMNLFNAIPSNNIQISLMNYNVLMSKVEVHGKNNSKFDLTIYNSLLKN